MNAYWNWLKQSEPLAERLRWCHVTDAWALRSIIEKGQLLPKACRIFQQDLTYLFYGRAAYRFRENEQVRLLSKAPVVCIFSNDLEQFGSQIYPFDTGAFDERYRKWLHPEMNVSMFALPCCENAPERQVGTFFGSSDQYLSMSPAAPSRDYVGAFEAEAVAEMYMDPSTEIADDRRLAIELQINSAIDFAPPNIAALVIPDRLREAEWFSAWYREVANAIEIATYDLSPRRLADHYQAELEAITKAMVFEGAR